MNEIGKQPPREWVGGVLQEGCDNERGHGSRSIVLKIGGSLLAQPAWVGRVSTLIDFLLDSGRVPTIVVGGGAIADGMRRIDATSAAAPALVHDLAIGCMTITARLVARVIGLPIVFEPPCDCAAVLDIEHWLARRQGAGLPASWDVTSDSIAASVAGHAPDVRSTLVLVKSVPPPLDAMGAGPSLTNLADAGWVDRHFPVAARRLRVEWFAPSSASLPEPARFGSLGESLRPDVGQVGRFDGVGDHGPGLGENAS